MYTTEIQLVGVLHLPPPPGVDAYLARAAREGAAG